MHPRDSSSVTTFPCCCSCCHSPLFLVTPKTTIGRSDNDVKNRWNLVCRRERAAEKNLHRAGSSGSATSAASAPPLPVSAAASGGAPPRHGRTLSSGTAETAAAAAVMLGGRPTSIERRGQHGRGDGGGGGGGGESRSLPPSRAVSSEEEQRSMMEAREAAEAGAGLVKVSVGVRDSVVRSGGGHGGCSRHGARRMAQWQKVVFLSRGEIIVAVG